MRTASPAETNRANGLQHSARFFLTDIGARLDKENRGGQQEKQNFRIKDVGFSALVWHKESARLLTNQHLQHDL